MERDMERSSKEQQSAQHVFIDEQRECAQVTTLPAKALQHTALARVGCKAVQRLFVDLSVDTETIAVTRQAVQH